MLPTAERETLSRVNSKKLKPGPPKKLLPASVQRCFWTSFCAAALFLMLLGSSSSGGETQNPYEAYQEAAADQGQPRHLKFEYRRGRAARANLVRGAAGSFEENESPLCDGRRVFMYEMPAKFNLRLAKLCKKGIIWWLDICQHFENDGFGPKIWVTRDVRNKWADWYGTDPYMLETIFYSRMQEYACRTENPGRADAFFVPWFAGLDALPWLFEREKTESTQGGQFGEELFRWLDTDPSSREWWGRYGGKDHFAVLGRTVWDFISNERWGTGFLALPQATNLTSLMLEAREVWFENERAIPYPTSFHPSSPWALEKWVQRARAAKRDHLMAYVGAPRPKIGSSIRGVIESQCVDTTSAQGGCAFVNCTEVECSQDPVSIAKALLKSEFCLQPRGDSATRRSTFDCIIAGAIPVFFHEDTAYSQFRWHLPGDHDSYSVFIPESQIRQGSIIRNLLKSFSREKVLEMRENVLSLIPRVVYNNYANAPGGGAMDAFELAIEGVTHRVKKYRAQQVS